MASSLEGRGFGTLNTLGQAGINAASRGWDRLHEQSMFERQLAEDDFRRREAERARKKAEKKARMQRLANIGISVGTSAALGGLDAALSPAVDAAADTAKDVATDAATDTAKEAATDTARDAATGTASHATDDLASGFSRATPTDAAPVYNAGGGGPVRAGDEGFSRMTANDPGLVEPTPGFETGGLRAHYEPGREPGLVHTPRNDGVSRTLDRGGRTTYDPASGTYTTRESAGRGFLRGAAQGAVAGGIYALASEFPGVAPVAQAAFNRMDPLYRARVDEIRGRGGYNAARADRVRTLTPYEVDSTQAQGFQRRAAGVNSLASADEHAAGADFSRTMLPEKVNEARASTGRYDSQTRLNDERTDQVRETTPGKVSLLDSQARERDSAADRNRAAGNLYGARQRRIEGQEDRDTRLFDDRQRKGAADADLSEERRDRMKGESALINKQIKYGTPEQRDQAIMKLIGEAEANIDAAPMVDGQRTDAQGNPVLVPNADVQHATIERYLRQWRGLIPEDELLSIENGWRRKYKYAPRPRSTSSGGLGVELEE